MQGQLLPLRPGAHHRVVITRRRQKQPRKRRGAALLIATAYRRAPPSVRIEDCEQDARDMRDALRRHGFSEQQLLLGRSASRPAVLRSLRALMRRSHSVDHVVLFFSGHGVQQRGSAEPDGLDEAIMCDDMLTITDDTLRQELARCAPTCTLLSIFDCCTSGSITDGCRLRDETQGPGVCRLTIAACRDGKTAQQRGGRGVLTQELCRRMRSGRLSVSGLHGCRLAGGQVTTLSGTSGGNTWLPPPLTEAR